MNYCDVIKRQPRMMQRQAIDRAATTSFQFLKRTVPTSRTRTITKKAYRTSVRYFLVKIEEYRTVLMYRIVLPFLLLANRNFN